jgi:phosphomevalonate kinase
LNIYITADNDFYSQIDYLTTHNKPLSISSLKSVPKFNPTNKELKNVLKTGLGSSAAMVTSLVAALLLHFKAVSTKLEKKDLIKIEQLAQCNLH